MTLDVLALRLYDLFLDNFIRGRAVVYAVLSICYLYFSPSQVRRF